MDDKERRGNKGGLELRLAKFSLNSARRRQTRVCSAKRSSDYCERRLGFLVESLYVLLIQDLNYIKVELDEAIKREYLEVAISTYRISLPSDFGFVPKAEKMAFPNSMCRDNVLWRLSNTE